ncbi:hypothetical protein DT603_11385 [Pseudoxanthomonas gei]|uniref:Uncharacterized protein n=2 Tax=Pseudoxanthomonas gei TaxID=1383030 RepID=A0ABX0AJ05_9GAMM|nr:hypothetical protein [Pseudoxanthomonas gei]
MKMLKLAMLALSLAPPLALAQSVSASESLRVPGIMTPSGQRFASTCTDAAFAQAADSARLARRCQTLLAHWRGEAELALVRRDNPRVRAVAILVPDSNALLPFDTVAALRTMPLQMSSGR